MDSSAKKIFVIAGEASGDKIGADLIRALKQKNPQAQIQGIGGENMLEAGLPSSLFPMREISLFGFLEVLPHIFSLMKKMRATVKAIKEFAPDVVVTIDSPGFNFRIAKKLKKLKNPPKLVHYVAPTVWAYKEHRAKKCAKLFDEMLCILPFEPPYFERHGLKTKFVGHPIIYQWQEFMRTTSAHKPQADLFSTLNICIFFGSRKSEIARLSQPIIGALKLMQKEGAVFNLNVPTTPHMLPVLQEKLEKAGIEANFVTNEQAKKQAMLDANFAICKSGTIAVEAALAQIPHVIIYKVNKISAALLKRMVKVKFFNLINITADREIIPELMQEKCTAKNIADIAMNLIQDKENSVKQVRDSLEILAQMGLGAAQSPSEVAANEILSI